MEIPDSVDSKYRFVIISALRARQIQGGSRPLIDDMGRKATMVAQQEVLQDLIPFIIPEKTKKT
jgi:DNA-directed RNA polymerase omega subunit